VAISVLNGVLEVRVFLGYDGVTAERPHSVTTRAHEISEFAVGNHGEGNLVEENLATVATLEKDVEVLLKDDLSLRSGFTEDGSCHGGDLHLIV